MAAEAATTYDEERQKVDVIAATVERLQSRLEKLGGMRPAPGTVAHRTVVHDTTSLFDQTKALEQQMDLAVMKLRSLAKKAGVEDEVKIDDAVLDVECDFNGGKMPLPGVVNLPSLSGFKDLSLELTELKKRFGRHYASLLRQSWKPLPGAKGSHSFRVVQFNQLADALCTAYSKGTGEKTFLGVDKAMLRWTYRGLRMVELICHNINPELLYIEECDRYDDFWQPWLAFFGYDSIYQAKSRSPTRHCAKQLKKEFPELVSDAFSCTPDGLVIAWKKDVFKMQVDSVQRIDDQSGDDNPHKCVALAVTLAHIASGMSFLAVCSHFKSDKERDGETLRVNQAKALFGNSAGALLRTENADGSPLPLVFGCDLNANPIINRHGYAPRCYEWLTAADGCDLKSAYRDALGTEPEFTTAKKRVNGVDMHTIDYLFHKAMPADCSVSEFLEVPRLGVGQLIPDWYYPSDHFAIGVQLSFTPGSKVPPPRELLYDFVDGVPPLPGVTQPKVQFHLGRDLKALSLAFGPLAATHSQKWHLVAEIGGKKTSHSFSIVQWNALSDALSTGYTQEPHKKDFLGVDKRMLRWSYRGLRLVEQMLALSPDVFCIEEVDFAEYLELYLKEFGYQCFYQAKDKSPTRHISKQVAAERGVDASTVPVQADGVVVALKTSAFKVMNVVKMKQSEFKTKATFGVFVHVKHVDSCRQMVFGSTHLKSDKDLVGEQLRERQIEELMGRVSTEFEGLPVFLGCDLNAAPTAAGKDYEPLCVRKCEALGLQSAYATPPLYTTLKKRVHGVDKHTIDYIWSREAAFARVSHLLSIPGLDSATDFATEVDPDSDPLLVPDWRYPSDHFAIGAVYHLE